MKTKPKIIPPALFCRPSNHSEWGKLCSTPIELVDSPYQAGVRLEQEREKWRTILLDHEFKIDEDTQEAFYRCHSNLRLSSDPPTSVS